MKEILHENSDSSLNGFSQISQAASLCKRWKRLCEKYLPIETENSIWRYNRRAKHSEPLQGWKLHISATILNACDLFEKVAPILCAKNVQFKAPKSLDELSRLNSGLNYGYTQVGKFITIYPPSAEIAVELAAELHRLTEKFQTVAIPFDNQYLPESSVFYRYGAFQNVETSDENGRIFSALKTPDQQITADNRYLPVPDWIENPFPESPNRNRTEELTPLTTTFKVFRSITQRGKGGTYEAFDLSSEKIRFCLVKEGRRFGEIGWNGQDGFDLVKNESEVLRKLAETGIKVPQIYADFEIDGNVYLVTEFIEGSSLQKIMNKRRRRFSVRKILHFGIEIALTIVSIHHSGWVWNDCKPANIIVEKNGSLRAIDFENAFRIGQKPPFQWKTSAFSHTGNHFSHGFDTDIYAFGAVLYYLLTGKLIETENPPAISELRPQTPKKFAALVEAMLKDANSTDLEKVIFNLRKILAEF